MVRGWWGSIPFDLLSYPIVTEKNPSGLDRNAFQATNFGRKRFQKFNSLGSTQDIWHHFIIQATLQICAMYYHSYASTTVAKSLACISRRNCQPLMDLGTYSHIHCLSFADIINGQKNLV